MRLVFLSQPRDPIEARGAQRGSVAIVLWELATRLARRHEMIVLAPKRPGQAAEEWSAEGIRLIREVPPADSLHRLLEETGDLLPGTTPHLARSGYFAGYRGRLALHEVMRVTEEIERHAVAHSSAADISATAVKQGMITLREDGWYKVAAGDTSIEEILRVVA